MSIFVDYDNAIFPNLSNTKTTLIAADSNALWVNSIIVCNRSKQTIRFNLQQIKSSTDTSEVFLINEFEIDPLESVDVLNKLGLTLNLKFSAIPGVSDSIVCFSNGSTQVFDCTVVYSKLNELPIA